MFGKPLLAIGILLCGLAILELVFAAADALIADANWHAFLISGVLSGVIGAAATPAFWSSGGDDRQAD